MIMTIWMPYLVLSKKRNRGSAKLLRNNIAEEDNVNGKKINLRINLI